MKKGKYEGMALDEMRALGWEPNPDDTEYFDIDKIHAKVTEIINTHKSFRVEQLTQDQKHVIMGLSLEYKKVLPRLLDKGSDIESVLCALISMAYFMGKDDAL